jgi:hypothetical protein
MEAFGGSPWVTAGMNPAYRPHPSGNTGESGWKP